jgi:uncharacterized protein (DUF362 family)
MNRREALKLLGGSAAGLIATAASGPMARLPATPLPVAPALQTPARVAIAQAASYDLWMVRQQMRTLLDSLGGLKGSVGCGDRVAIKVNLTGGTRQKSLPGISAIESYVTHPHVVQALAELLRDAGARRLYIVEGIFDGRSYVDWGYEAVARAVGATLVDLNSPEPYTEFGNLPVGQSWYVYRKFTLHHLLEEVDTFVSVAKMKCHWWAGVTLTMKNLVGLAPVSAYNSSPGDLNRSSFHGDSSVTGLRLPRVIADLNLARPIDLALIDGIKTVEGGEGPWEDLSPVNAGVLVAGKNAVATDAVGMAVMGFDPTVEMPNPPFLRGLNHLNIAHALGLGTNRLDEIEVTGTQIDAVQRRFRPCVPTALF